MESRAEKFTDVWRMNCVTQRHEVHPLAVESSAFSEYEVSGISQVRH